MLNQTNIRSTLQTSNPSVQSQYLQQQSQVQGGIFSSEQAQKLSQRLFNLYDSKNQGFLTAGDVQKLMIDLYRIQNKNITLYKNDIDEFMAILDKDRDGKVTRQDITDMAFQIMVSPEKNYSGNTILNERIKIGRIVFQKIDKKNKGFLDEQGVRELMEETQRYMGNNVKVTQEDAFAFMRTLDTSAKGYVTQEYNLSINDYEQYIIESLQRQGLIFS